MENQTDKISKSEEKTEAKAMVERMEALAIRIELANAETAKLQARNELGGESEAGARAPTPVKLTDIEYANKVKLGLVNPLQEDGYL